MTLSKDICGVFKISKFQTRRPPENYMWGEYMKLAFYKVKYLHLLLLKK